MRIRTVHFGELEVGDEDIIEFNRGPIPFVGLRRYVFLAWDSEAPFQWLQSVQVPHLAMVVVPVACVFPDFRPQAGPEEAAWLATEEEEVSWFAVVVLGDSPERTTANLLAPIAVNFPRRRAAQVIQELPIEWARRPLLAVSAGEPTATTVGGRPQGRGSTKEAKV